MQFLHLVLRMGTNTKWWNTKDRKDTENANPNTNPTKQ